MYVHIFQIWTVYGMSGYWKDLVSNLLILLVNRQTCAASGVGQLNDNLIGVHIY